MPGAATLYLCDIVIQLMTQAGVVTSLHFLVSKLLARE